MKKLFITLMATFSIVCFLTGCQIHEEKASVQDSSKKYFTSITHHKITKPGTNNDEISYSIKVYLKERATKNGEDKVIEELPCLEVSNREVHPVHIERKNYLLKGSFQIERSSVGDFLHYSIVYQKKSDTGEITGINEKKVMLLQAVKK